MCSILALHSFFLFYSILFCVFILFHNSHPVFSVLPLVSSFFSLLLIMLTHKRTNWEPFFFLFFSFLFSYFNILFFLSFRFIFPSYICVFFLFLFIINLSFFLLMLLHTCSSFILLFLTPYSLFCLYFHLFLITKIDSQLHPLVTCQSTVLTSLTRPFSSPERRKNKYGWPGAARYTTNV